MSYAEQHIFLANRVLTQEERQHADSLSSHAAVGSNYAIYTYVYGGSFRGDENELLTDTFDAMLWQDSSDSFHLRFRLPIDLVPPGDLLPYLAKKKYPPLELEMVPVGENTILSIRCNIEDGESIWLEDDIEPLQELMPIRADLLAGDYRVLYLIWRHNQTQYEEEGESTEKGRGTQPPTPPGLNELPDYLINFCDRCYIDHEEIVADSPESEPLTIPDYDHNLNFLDKGQMLDYLRGILNEEPDLAAKLRRELAGFDE